LDYRLWNLAARRQTAKASHPQSSLEVDNKIQVNYQQWNQGASDKSRNSPIHAACVEELQQKAGGSWNKAEATKGAIH